MAEVQGMPRAAWRGQVAARLGPGLQAALFPAAFLWFLAGGYLLRPNPLWAMVGFYLVLMPATFYALWRAPGARQVLRDPGVLLALAAVAWFGLSLLWGENQPPRWIRHYVIGVPTNALFLAGAILFFALAEERWLRRLLLVVAMALALNAALSFALFFGTGHSLVAAGGARMPGWAETRHPILGAGVACIGVIAAAQLLALAERRRERLAAIAAMALGILFVLATGSRGPVLALLLGLGVFGAFRMGWRGVAALGIGLAVLALGVLAVAGPDWVIGHLQRPSFRDVIWRVALERWWTERPLFGHGIANASTFGFAGGQNSPHPHGLIVSVLFYGGAVGLLLVLGAFALGALRSLGLGAWRAYALAGLSFGLIFGITDIGQPVRPPAEHWYVLWLPLGTALGLGLRGAVAASGRAGARPPPGSPAGAGR
jgi:O-antigen ligase